MDSQDAHVCHLSQGLVQMAKVWCNGAGWNLPYSQGLFGMELTFMVLFVAVEFPRLKLGSSGNKAEKLFHLVLMLAISTAVLLFLAYYTSWQVFVYAACEQIF